MTGRNRSILRLTIERKSGLGDANNREWIGVDLNGLADDRRVGRERTLPEPVRDHNDGVFSRRDVVSRLNRAEARADAEDEK